MVLLSIHSVCRQQRPRRQQLILSASLDNRADATDVDSTIGKSESKRRPPTLAPTPSRSIASRQVTTIELSGASNGRIIRKDPASIKSSTGRLAATTTTKTSPPTRTGLSEQAFAAIRTQKNEISKHVRFSAIHIREHAITVGDHEWCEGSLPIQLDWQHSVTRSIPVDDFEWQRQRQGRVPRGRLPKLDFAQRKKLLRRVSGITEEDLLLMERQHIDSKYVTLHCSKTVTFYHR